MAAAVRRRLQLRRAGAAAVAADARDGSAAALPQSQLLKERFRRQLARGAQLAAGPAVAGPGAGRPLLQGLQAEVFEGGNLLERGACRAARGREEGKQAAEWAAWGT